MEVVLMTAMMFFAANERLPVQQQVFYLEGPMTFTKMMVGVSVYTTLCECPLR